MVDLWDLQDESRRIGTRPRTVGGHFAIEQPLLKALPDEPFETGLLSYHGGASALRPEIRQPSPSQSRRSGSLSRSQQDMHSPLLQVVVPGVGEGHGQADGDAG
jgi:hypothetical protein